MPNPKSQAGVSAGLAGLVTSVSPIGGLKLREWERASRLLSLVVITGWLAERTPAGTVDAVRPASILFFGGPGSGKTELIDRFRRCYWVNYHSDLTVRSLLTVLRRAESGVVKHLGATEFNKFFQRKAAVAENCIGLLGQAMEEGVEAYSVGGTTMRFKKVRIGLLAAMTPRTLERRQDMLADTGFLSRCATIEWQLPREERDEIKRRINIGDRRDTEPITLPLPTDAPGTEVATIGGSTHGIIQWKPEIGIGLLEYTKRHWPEDDLRVFQRFRRLAMANAYLAGRRSVTRDDFDVVMSYDDYWKRMVVTGD